MKRYRLAYNAGWRAGMSGASSNNCPLSGLRGLMWNAGWCAGARRQLTLWLIARGA